MNDLLEQQIRETYAEHDAGYDPGPAADRLQRRSYTPRTARWPAMLLIRTGRVRLRATLAVTAALAVGAIALAAVLTSAGTAGVGSASAQQLIARTAAAVTRSGNGILHVNATTTYTQGHLTYEIDRWSEQTRPYRYWAAARTTEETQAETIVGNRATLYVSKSNRISIGKPSQVGQIPDPLLMALQTLNAPSAFSNSQIAITDENGSSIGTLGMLAKILTEMSKAPHVTVNRHTTLHGIPAISITAANHWSTLYVKPHTYAPLGFVVTGPSEDDATTTIFKTYETLPIGSVQMPDLIKEHPHATVTSRG